MFRSMMLPTDLGDDSDLMLTFAAGLPALGVRRLVLAHVVDTTGLEAPVVAATVDEARWRLHEACRALEGPGLAVETRVATGVPPDAVLALAAETQVEAIVCGSHGRGVVDQLFLGSVSDRIMRDARLPRFVVRFDLLRNSAEPPKLCSGFGSKMLVPTDFSVTSTRAFLAALDLPTRSIGTMYLLHALDPSLAGEKRRRAEEGAEFELKNMCDMAAEHGITAKAVIAVSDPVRAVLAEADERRITGIVVGTRGRSPLQEALLGSVSMTLLRQAACPLMVLS